MSTRRRTFSLLGGLGMGEVLFCGVVKNGEVARFSRRVDFDTEAVLVIGNSYDIEESHKSNNVYHKLYIADSLDLDKNGYHTYVLVDYVNSGDGSVEAIQEYVYFDNDYINSTELSFNSGSKNKCLLIIAIPRTDI